MGKIGKVILVLFLLIIAAAAIIGGDIYMSYRGITEKAGEFDVGSTVFDMAADNSSADITTTVTTPKLGYMPKSIRMDLIILKNDTQYGNPQVITIKLGDSQEIGFNVTFVAADILAISSGGTISIKIEVTITPVYIGIPLDFLTQVLDPILIDFSG